MAALKRHLPRQHLPIHHPIAHQRIKRLAERCRTVLFKAEMADPGEALATQERSRQPPEVGGQQQGCQAGQRQGGADKMQFATHAVGVLAQVEGVKLGKGLVFLFNRGRHDPLREIAMATE